MKLHKIFTINLFVIVAIFYLISLIVTYFAVKNFETKEIKSSLIETINTLELSLETTSDLELLANQIHSISNTRATFIDESGVVIAESHKDKSIMDNHLQRPEIIKASNEIWGDEIRYSTSVHRDFLYVAKKSVYHNQPIYIRLSKDISIIDNKIYNLWKNQTIFLTLSFFVVWVFTVFANRIIKRELSKVTSYLHELSQKNYKQEFEMSQISEFHSIQLAAKKLAKRLIKKSNTDREFNAKLKLKNRQLSDLIAAISHEFKNPIAAIMGYAQTIQEGGTLNPQILTVFTGKIYNNATKLTKLIDKISFLTRFQNNELVPEFGEYNIISIAKESWDMLKHKHKHRELLIEYTDDVIVKCDKMMFDAIFTNLLDNAFKYSTKSVILRITPQTVEVVDFGIGIEPSQIEKIKNKYYRVDNNQWNNSMGLGLSLVEYLLHLHQTNLDIKSTLGVGSTFSFLLRSVHG